MSANIDENLTLKEALLALEDAHEKIAQMEGQLSQVSQFQEIIDHLPSMIFMKEVNELRYVHFNRAGEELIGISREDIIGKNDYDLFPKEQADFFNARDQIVLAFGELEDIPDEPMDTPSGTRRLHTRKVAIKDENGKPKYLLGISNDITEHKEMMAERERLQRELQQAHKMESLGHLTGGIAHDFNNLLGIITGYTTLACDICTKQNNEKLNDYLNHIIAASDRATSLVAQLLAFSRKGIANEEPLYLEPLLLDDVKMLRATLPSTIELETDIEQELPPVIINATQFNQILMNLVINARDAMDSSGRITIRLGWAKNMNAQSSVSHKQVKGDWVELSVTDTGDGIDPSIVDDIFTPYFTNKKPGEGTGMGLSVIYGIMQAHNGHIILDTEPGEGSTFRLLFPPVDDASVDDSSCEIRMPTEKAIEKKHILVVDDEISLASFIGELVRNYGYTAEIFTDSSEAYNYYKNQPEKFSMLITDQTMPKLTGLDLIDKVRDITPDLPVILCSGYSELIDDKKLAKRNIRFFEKPLQIGVLINAVNKLLDVKTI